MGYRQLSAVTVATIDRRAKAWIGRHGDQFAVTALTVLGAPLLTKGSIELLG